MTFSKTLDINRVREIRRNCYRKYREKNIKRVHDRRQKLTEFFTNYKKGKKCSFCPENEVVALDFHHLGDKDVNPSRMSGLGWSIEHMKRELDKCIIICSNCHRKVHAGIIKVDSSTGRATDSKPVL